MHILLYLFVIGAGALSTIESGANAKLSGTLGGAWWAAILFNAVTLALTALVGVFVGGPFPMRQLAEVPWWAWAGGLISAVYVMCMMIAPRLLGAGLFTGLVVTAGISTSIALDHWGLVGFAVHPAGVWRLAGAALMIAGLALVAAF